MTDGDRVRGGCASGKAECGGLKEERIRRRGKGGKGAGGGI